MEPHTDTLYSKLAIITAFDVDPDEVGKLTEADIEELMRLIFSDEELAQREVRASWPWCC